MHQTDIAGNTSSNTGNAGAITVDSTARHYPWRVALTTDTGASSSDRITNTAGLTPSERRSRFDARIQHGRTNWSTSAPTAAEGRATVLYCVQTDVASGTSSRFVGTLSPTR
ncbi:MAG: hypothetical protein KF778_13145 [Rhodocyclaceae bacterium]|nr:hypothetical protein [Rhodocyclaceae bacterium]